MNSADLDRLIAQWETASVEFKEKLSDDVVRGLSTDVAALANSQGGVVIFGVSKDRRPVGVQLEGNEREKISQQAGNCRPAVRIDFEEVPFGPLKFLVLKVPRSSVVHSDSERRFPIRIGDVTDYLDALGLLAVLQERGILNGTENVAQAFHGPVDRERLPLSGEDRALLLDALRSSRRETLMEGFKDLMTLSYRVQVLGDKSIEEAVERGVTSEDTQVCALALDISRNVLVYGTDDEKAAVRRWIDRIAEIAKPIPPLPTSTTPNGSRAMDILIMSSSPLVVDVLQAWFTHTDAKDLNISGMFSNARSYGLDRIVRTAMYALLESDNVNEGAKKRISEVLENLRRG